MENQTFEFYGTHIENENSILSSVEENEEKPKSKLQEIKEQLFLNDKNQGDKKIRDEFAIQKYNCPIEIKKQKNKENLLIYKDNLLAQKARLNFSELEQKALNYCISKIKPNIDYTNKAIDFSVYEIFKFLKLNYEKNYVELKQALKSLRDKSVWVPTKKGGKELFYFLSQCKIEPNENDNNKLWVSIKFNDSALKLLQNLQENFYTQYLYYTSILKGKYTIQLYELCKSWESNKEFIFNINDIREKWSIPKSYSTHDIKRKIIEYAKKQINEKTDIEIDITKTYKSNQNISSYKIKIEKNKLAIIKNTQNFISELEEIEEKEKENSKK